MMQRDEVQANFVLIQTTLYGFRKAIRLLLRKKFNMRFISLTFLQSLYGKNNVVWLIRTDSHNPILV